MERLPFDWLPVYLICLPFVMLLCHCVYFSNTGIPMLMSFKDFIIQQEDDIDEVESVRRYQEYKVEFKRTQINDFFVLHKNEEW